MCQNEYLWSKGLNMLGVCGKGLDILQGLYNSLPHNKVLDLAKVK